MSLCMEQQYTNVMLDELLNNFIDCNSACETRNQQTLSFGQQDMTITSVSNPSGNLFEFVLTFTSPAQSNPLNNFFNHLQVGEWFTAGGSPEQVYFTEIASESVSHSTTGTIITLQIDLDIIPNSTDCSPNYNEVYQNLLTLYQGLVGGAPITFPNGSVVWTRLQGQPITQRVLPVKIFCEDEVDSEVIHSGLRVVPSSTLFDFSTLNNFGQELKSVTISIMNGNADITDSFGVVSQIPAGFSLTWSATQANETLNSIQAIQTDNNGVVVINFTTN